ncbi:MAG: hypothetical protein V4772_08970 [Pseudomonadota bacterium]
MSINIDNVTFGEAKQIAALFGAVSATPTVKDHPFVGQFVICRCFGAGVHSGHLVSMSGSDVILKDSRRLWSWKAKAGIALSGLAQNGMADGMKIDTMNPVIALTDVIECIPASKKCEESINGLA